MDVFAIIVVLVAGIGAGVITGLVGASAVMIMAPLLIIFLKMNPYLAIGISLSTDVVASIVAGRIYWKNKHVDLQPIIFLILFSFAGIVIGSYASTFMNAMELSGATGFGALITGLILLKKKNLHKNKSNFLERFRLKFRKKRNIWLSVIGLIVGLDVGIFGTGGGMIMLLVLVFILDYEMHIAVGTSIIVMSLMAFTGGVVHYYYDPFSLPFLGIACVGAFIGARYSSIFANHISEERLKKIAGIILIVLGFLLITKIFFW
jgi:uncharacterized protein